MAVHQLGLFEISTLITVQFDCTRRGIECIELRNFFCEDLIADEGVRQRHASAVIDAGIANLLVDFAQIDVFTFDSGYLIVVDVGLFVAPLGHEHITDLYAMLPRFSPSLLDCFCFCNRTVEFDPTVQMPFHLFDR